MNTLNILYLLVLAPFLTECQMQAWNVGQKFVFGIPELYRPSSSYYLDMAITAYESTEVAIEAPGSALLMNYTLASGTRRISLSRNLICSGVSLSNNSILVSSDRRVSIYVMSYDLHNADGFHVLPYSDRSRDFYVATYYSNIDEDQSQFVVAAAFDNTNVRVTVKCSGTLHFNQHTYTNGQTFNVTLNKYNTLQIQSSFDLTGTRVESDKPIGVVSGNKCTDIPVEVAACDYIVEQLPPVVLWGNKHIVTNLKTRLRNRLRVISATNNNHISIGSVGSALQITLQKGEYHEYFNASDAINFILSKDPILVLQFSEGGTADNRDGDPSMLVVPTLDTIGSDYSTYIFATPSGFMSHYISITIETKMISGIRLDNIKLDRSDEKVVTVNTSGTLQTFSIVRIHVTEGTHTVTHVNGVTFNGLLYGFGEFVSYGFPLAVPIKDIITGLSQKNGTSLKSGQIQVRIDGVWYSVCASNMNRNLGSVVCKSLGYDKYGVRFQGLQNMTNDFSTQRTIGGINCVGGELSIAECLFVWKPCDTSTVVGVDCAPPLQEIISSHCSPDSWHVVVDMEKLDYRFPGSKASVIYLGENSCTGVLQNNQLVFDYTILSCGTNLQTTEQEIIYSNEMVYAYHDPHYYFIVRNFNWTDNIKCHIPRNQSTDSEVLYNQTTGNSQAQMNSTGLYSITTELFLDPNFQQSISVSPIHVALGSNLFVKAYVQNVDYTIKMKLQSCYTTPSNGDQSLKYYLIKNGCEMDSNTHLLTQTDHETRFVFQMFEVTGIHGDLYIRCDAIFCDTTDIVSSQQCNQHCT